MGKARIWLGGLWLVSGLASLYWGVDLYYKYTFWKDVLWLLMIPPYVLIRHMVIGLLLVCGGLGMLRNYRYRAIVCSVPFVIITWLIVRIITEWGYVRNLLHSGVYYGTIGVIILWIITILWMGRQDKKSIAAVYKENIGHVAILTLIFGIAASVAATFIPYWYG